MREDFNFPFFRGEERLVQDDTTCLRASESYRRKDQVQATNVFIKTKKTQGIVREGVLESGNNCFSLLQAFPFFFRIWKEGNERGRKLLLRGFGRPITNGHESRERK